MESRTPKNASLDITKKKPVTLHIPVLLLKTKSLPSDAYDELFMSARTSVDTEEIVHFDPIFIPVLEHRLDNNGIAQLRNILVNGRIQNSHAYSCNNPRANTRDYYGGMIFTSQHAVEAFAKTITQGSNGTMDSKMTRNTSWSSLQGVPIYSVGPATSRALRAIPHQPPLQVMGEHAGNGEDLAHYIREQYGGSESIKAAPADKVFAPLLFVVGENHRDIIPKLLMSGGRGPGKDPNFPYIHVDELVVYGTGIMESFQDDLRTILYATKDRPVRWAVIFSPTGCDSLLNSLGLLDPATGRFWNSSAAVSGSLERHNQRTTFVATIGPTTRAYLRDCFGFEPDVCAAEPTAQGVLRGIQNFMAMRAGETAGK